ncbi:MAG: C4-dicarboxylate ABC transporter permease [Dethiosulfovibrio peptidovorans]|nr:MAG: C4-dicarboxylate ABC transporter permease [Dethiosulfovibrio peptidovorans]
MTDFKYSADRGFYSLVERFGNNLELWLQVPVLILAVIMTVSVLLGVLFRYVFQSPLGWSEEFSRYVMIWMALLSVALCIWRQEHVGVTMFVKKLPRSLAKGVIFASNGLNLAFLSVLMIYGFQMAQRGKAQIATGLGTSMEWWLMSVPVSAGICMVMLICKMILDIRRTDLDEMLMSEELVDAVKREEGLDF